MSTDNLTQEQVERLGELVEQVDAERDVIWDAWLGKRSHPRRALNIPAVVRAFEKDALGPPSTHWVMNISKNGMCLFSHHPYQEWQWLWVEIEVNGTAWGGRMQVVHLTSIADTYRIGLVTEEPVEEPSAEGQHRRQNARRRQQERMWLTQARLEIRKSSQAYQLARRTWGLLGTPVQKEIRKALEQLGQTPAAPPASTKDNRRENQRLTASGDARIVFHTAGEWRQVPARILDVSEGGIRVAVAVEADDDYVEWELIGAIRFRTGMAVVVGMGVGTETVWVPAEVVRCEKPLGEIQHLGLRFNTPCALQAFQV